ncbi:uncharacterized protein BT62DRAFT_196572 [Guyanagaster necrorhizus]|uniref:Uncharacterized protein n=1 Tax=Guyanagaster necrorhizus TaxID=856835 RepID=A0A9P7VR19_9AGAR|nr:uncharacterized protein BT62DRAFT_196572 [Guyanagaster necrorhizus MCA 3950]KAG7444885.1 hypothetical protein BT62DRAFT_196572 [Guyanagaster necrorhizus MCA 3950]
MLSNFMAPEVLTLRRDAQVGSYFIDLETSVTSPYQVMLIKNTDDSLVNGSMGRVLRFVDPMTYGIEDDVEALLEDGSSKPSSKPPSKPAKKNAVVGAVQLYPEVEFVLPHGTRRRVLIMPELSKVELPNGELQVSRSQVRKQSWIIFVMSLPGAPPKASVDLIVGYVDPQITRTDVR